MAVVANINNPEQKKQYKLLKMVPIGLPAQMIS